ncbi:MAG: TonB-dependent receptor [Sphingomonadaceae bacterium]
MRNAYAKSLQDKRRLLAGVGLSALGLAAFASPVYAQDSDDTEPPVVINNDTVTTETDGQIVVTGSRIRRDNFETSSQINVITREDAILAGATSTAEVLQNSSVTSGTSQINGSFLGYVSEGGTAANTVGLRGFGSARTLTLLNGRRLAPAGVGPELVAADLNVLPSAVIQRVEVLREGASSVYGSDAIAGVINVITEKKMDGITIDGFTNQPITHGGGGRTYRGSIVAGKTFERGYITGSFEYRERTGLALDDRGDVFGCPRDLYYDPTTGAEVGQIDPKTGQLQCFPYTTNGGVGTASGYGIFFNFTTGAFGRLQYDDTPAGSPNRQVNGVNRVSPNLIQNKDDIIAPVKTYTGYLAAGYELGVLGDAEIYTEALFTRRQSSYSYSRQLSINTGILSPNIEVYGGSYAGTPLSAYGYPTSPFFPDVLSAQGINYFTPFIQPNRLSKSEQRVDFVRWNGGLRGNLPFSDWRYDANLQYSRTKSRYNQPQITIDRLNNALQTVLAPAGTPSELIVVAGPGTAGAGSGYTCASNVDGGGSFIAGSSCVPLDLYSIATFRDGAIPDNQYNYVYQQEIGNTKFEQITASFIVDGTLFELPGGSVRAAFGYEHRQDKIADVPSIAAQTGQLYNFSSAGITAGKDNVDEVFGEIIIPLISDKPFARLLEVSGSGRYTNYASFGSDFTYHLNAQWAPNEIIRFRGNYGTSFRAPNLFEQFVADQTGFYPSGVDPCSGFGTAYTPGNNIYDNCLAELTRQWSRCCRRTILPVDFGPQVVTKGNVLDLKAETSRFYGFGAVFTLFRAGRNVVRLITGT